MTPDLTTRYLGLELKNPLVVAACPLTGQIEILRRLVDAGAAAVVLPSLFEEQIDHDQMAVFRFYESSAESIPEALSYFPELDDYNTGPAPYLRHISAAKKAIPVPVIASLNGTSNGGWVRHAQQIQEAGADALELNIYFVCTEPYVTGEQLEARYLELVAAVREVVSIPLAVKIGPYFSSLPNMASRLVNAGADGLVLFNRFLQPDIDLETLKVVPRMVLSTSDELRLPLRWIAILRAFFDVSLAATTGVHTAEDVLKLLLTGADVTMVASALYQHGPDHIRTLLDGVTRLARSEGVLLGRPDEGEPQPGQLSRPGRIRASELHQNAHTLYRSRGRFLMRVNGPAADGREEPPMTEQVKTPETATDAHPSGDDRFSLLDATMKRHRYRPDALIEVLHTAQKVFGRLDHDVLLYVAHGLKLPPSRVYGVATFYHSVHIRPKGPTHLRRLHGHLLLCEGI